MKKVDTKNYVFLMFLLLGTVFITLLVTNIYKSKQELVSEFYDISKKITVKEFDEYIIENPDTIIYISDRYDLTNEEFEEEFELKLKKLNLIDKFVFMDKDQLSDEFLLELKGNYKTDINLEKLPVVMVVIDKNIEKIAYVDEYSNIDTFINYEVFE